MHKKKQLPGKRKGPGDPVACCSVNDLIGLQIFEVLAFHKSSCTTQNFFDKHICKRRQGRPERSGQECTMRVGVIAVICIDQH